MHMAAGLGAVLSAAWPISEAAGSGDARVKLAACFPSPAGSSGNSFELKHEWLTIQEDRILKKSVIEAGTGDTITPGTGDVITVALRIMGEKGTILQEMPRMTFRVGDGESLKVLERCLPFMRLGEKALIQSDVRCICGDTISKHNRLASGGILYLQVTLLAWKRPREALSVQEALQLADWKWEMGNSYSGARTRAPSAAACYREALKILVSISHELSTPEEKAQLQDIKGRCLSSLTRCCLRMRKFKEALRASNALLEDQPWNAMAIFRKGKVLFLMGWYFEAIELMEKSLQVQPYNMTVQVHLAGARRQYAQLKKAERDFHLKFLANVTKQNVFAAASPSTAQKATQDQAGGAERGDAGTPKGAGILETVAPERPSAAAKEKTNSALGFVKIIPWVLGGVLVVVTGVAISFFYVKPQ